MSRALEQRKESLIKLGEVFKSALDEEVTPIFPAGKQALLERIENAYQLNPWFTADNVRFALLSWVKALQPKSVEQWLSAYDFPENHNPKKIAVIAAGNVPLVGLHDILSVYMSGNKLIVRPSSDDARLTEVILHILIHLSGEPDYFSLQKERLTDFDAVIATGSDNSSRYFDYYFGKYPHIIRKNRNSVAILNGNETEEEMKLLAHDIFCYFGLGCRSVSKVYLPEDYDLQTLFKALFPYQKITDHNRYANNYDYQRSVFMMNKISIWENGFLLLREEESLASPIAVLHYERYADEKSIRHSLREQTDKIQCIVGSHPDYLDFGSTQSPQLWDYADGVDTIQFLLQLNK